MDGSRRLHRAHHRFGFNGINDLLLLPQLQNLVGVLHISLKIWIIHIATDNASNPILEHLS